MLGFTYVKVRRRVTVFLFFFYFFIRNVLDITVGQLW